MFNTYVIVYMSSKIWIDLFLSFLMIKIIIICIIGIALAVLNVWLDTKIKKKGADKDDWGIYCLACNLEPSIYSYNILLDFVAHRYKRF